MNPLSVSLPMLSAFINQTTPWRDAPSSAVKSENASTTKGFIMCKNERCYSTRRSNNRSNSLCLVFSLASMHLPPPPLLYLSALSPTFFPLYHLLPFCGSWRPSFVIQHECKVFHSDLYSVTNEIAAILPHAPTTKTETWAKQFLKTLFQFV